MQKQNGERSDLYIFVLAGIHNLIFVDISLAGMPLRTLFLLLADFLCIAVYICKGEPVLPHWRQCGNCGKVMTVLLAVSAVLPAVFALAGSEYFWISVDGAALLLIYPCIYGRKRFPQDIFCAFSGSSYVIYVLLLCHELAGGLCEPFIALLLRNDAVVSWLILSITMNMVAYCFQESGQAWYGGNILLAAFLLAIRKNVPALAVAGTVPLLIPIFCKPTKVLARRAAQAGFLYVFLLCNMSLITGYTPLLEGIVMYDLEISVYMELLLAAMGVWFFSCWDRYARKADNEDALPKMREWYRKAATACLSGIMGILVLAGIFSAEETSAWNRAAQIIVSDVKDGFRLQPGMIGQMGKLFGGFGIAAACTLFYVGVTRLHATKWWRIRGHKLYRLLAAVCLLQAMFLPFTMASLPIYVTFLLLFLGTEEERAEKTERIQKSASDYGEGEGNR